MNGRWNAPLPRWIRRRDEGQDLIEYGLLAALIAVVALVAVNALGGVIKLRFWDAVANLL